MASVSWLKMTKQKAASMKKHNGDEERVQLNHTNPDIDKSKSHLNYCIGCKDYADSFQKMCARVEEVDREFPMKTDRKDRKICVSLEVKCPQAIYDSGRQREFFEKAYSLFQNFFGEENVHGSCVHLDEIHPYIEDGVEKMSLAHSTTLVSGYCQWKDKNGNPRVGISAAKLECRTNLQKLNKAFCAMVRKEFGVEYNTGEKAKHKTVEQLKAQSELEEINLVVEAAKLKAQQLLNEKDELLTENEKLEEQISEKRKAIKDIDEQIINAADIPPQPQLPPPLPQDEPRPMREHRAYTREEERDLTKAKKSWDKSHAKGGERWSAEQRHEAQVEQAKKAQAEWVEQYHPIIAAKNVIAKTADKERELTARERQLQQQRQQAQAELERGRSEIEKNKRALEKRQRELDVEVGRQVQEQLARSDKFQRFIQTSAEFDKRIQNLYKGADKRNEKAFEEKVKAVQKGKGEER